MTAYAVKGVAPRTFHARFLGAKTHLQVKAQTVAINFKGKK